MTWWILALISSFLAAAFLGLNRYFKKDGLRLEFWNNAVQLVVLSPIIFVFQTGDPLFLLAAAISGFVLVFMDVRILDASRAHGGAVVAQVLALRIWLMFFVWSAIDFSGTLGLLERLEVFTGILGALALGSFSLWFMNRCSVSKAVVIMLVPALAAIVVHAVLLKITMDNFPEPEAALFYGFVAVLAGSVTSYCWLLVRRKAKEIYEISLIRAGIILGIISAVMLASRFTSFIDAPNPAYVYAIALLSTVWLYIAHKILRIPDRRNILAGFGLVVSAALLIWLTSG